MKEQLAVVRNQDIIHNVNFRKVEADFFAAQQLADELNTKVYGQEEATMKLAKAVVRSKAELTRHEQPMGVFFFLGNTGVGKTETAKALAKTMSPKAEEWQDHFIKIDCTGLQNEHEVANLAGSPPGYIGYGNEVLITPQMLQQGAVVCFDEIEKAHDSVIRWLLPVLEEGKTKIYQKTDKEVKPTILDFSRTMIIMTSNVGAEALQNRLKGKGNLGFGKAAKPQESEEVGKKALEEHFKHIPEFIGRIGREQIITFKELGQKEYVQIFNKYLDEVNVNQTQDPHFVSVTDEARSYLISKATHPQYGARDLISTINNELLSKVADIKVSLVLGKDQPLVAVLETTEEGKEELAFYTTDLPEIKPEITVFDDKKIIPFPTPDDSDLIYGEYPNIPDDYLREDGMQYRQPKQRTKRKRY